jgi:hypothetical protein
MIEDCPFGQVIQIKIGIDTVLLERKEWLHINSLLETSFKLYFSENHGGFFDTVLTENGVFKNNGSVLKRYAARGLGTFFWRGGQRAHQKMLMTSSSYFRWVCTTITTFCETRQLVFPPANMHTSCAKSKFTFPSGKNRWKIPSSKCVLDKT